jgi:SpoVK/Ycf46/Vps4 family AAA+-type ATPase
MTRASDSFPRCIPADHVARKLSRHRLNALFSGQSGTDKTMAAEALACELSLDLYQADLSTVVSKCIGETEKHLSAIFQEAEDSQAILFFDVQRRNSSTT